MISMVQVTNGLVDPNLWRGVSLVGHGIELLHRVVGHRVRE